VFGCIARRGRFTRVRPHGIGCPFRVSCPAGVSRSWVPQSRSAVRPHAGYAVFPRQAARPQLSGRDVLSSGFAIRECCPMQPSLPNHRRAPLLGFASLQHVQGTEVHACCGLCLPAAFRPQGLLTLSTAYSLCARASFVSRWQRSWDSPFGAFSSPAGTEAFPPRRTHMPFSLSVSPARTRRMGRPNRPRLLGFDPAESPWRPDGG
jgi:hypothetical protein